MEANTVKIGDILFKLGNSVFNVQDVKFIGDQDLYYESSKTIGINKMFYTLEDYFAVVVSLIISFTHNIKSLLMTKVFPFAFKYIKTKKQNTKQLVNKMMEKKITKNNSAKDVINNNVRNRLLNTINEGLIIKTSNTNNKVIHNKRLKNQFITDIKEDRVAQRSKIEQLINLRPLLNLKKLTMFISAFFSFRPKLKHN